MNTKHTYIYKGPDKENYGKEYEIEPRGFPCGRIAIRRIDGDRNARSMGIGEFKHFYEINK